MFILFECIEVFTKMGFWGNFSRISWLLWNGYRLRVVPTQAILFLKSMSERDGSDIQRLWNWTMNFLIDSKSIEDDVIQIQSRSMLDPTLSDIEFNNKMAWVWSLDSGLPFKTELRKLNMHQSFNLLVRNLASTWIYMIRTVKNFWNYFLRIYSKLELIGNHSSMR